MDTNDQLISHICELFKNLSCSCFNSNHTTARDIVLFSHKKREVFRVYNYQSTSDRNGMYTWYLHISLIDESIRIPDKNTKIFLNLFKEKVDNILNIYDIIDDMKNDTICLKNKDKLKSLIRDYKLNKLT